jgi:MYXO-CTERM domain-containing protein
MRNTTRKVATVGRDVFLAVMASCAILAGPVPTANATSQITYVAIVEPEEHEDGDDDNGLWGLLGLLGLVGLVGLVRRGRRNEYLAGPADAPPATRYGDK